MKRAIHYFLGMALCAGIASCTTDNDTLSDVLENTAADGYVKSFTATIEEFGGMGDEAETRGDFVIANNNWTHTWAKGDTLGIFPNTGGQVDFPLTTYGTTKAPFDGGGWALKASAKYAAYYPYKLANGHYGNTGIKLNYTGQEQTANGSTAHLGAYDFMGSAMTAVASDGSVNFSLKRMSAVLWIELNVPAADTYTELEITSDNAPFITEADLNISGTEPTTTGTKTSKTISLKLKDIKVAKDGKLAAYMLVHPTALKTKASTLTLKLKGNSRTYTTDVAVTKDLTRNNGWKIAVNRIYNLTLIAAAEENEGVSFIKNSDGTVELTNDTNKAMLDKVTSLKITGNEDATVCDQIYLFKNLTKLECAFNSLTKLDVSKNTKLTELNCSDNQLTSLDVTKNTQLTLLSCGQNQLTTLDVTKNTQLTRLYCYNNQLTKLDVSKNTQLTLLSCGHNQLTSLDVSKNTQLTLLSCYGNLMSTLDITKCTSLKKSSTYCGNQWTDKAKKTARTLTLTARSADTTSLGNTSYDNKNVTVVNK